MSILLEDLVAEATASNGRAADRLDAEARDLRSQPTAASDLRMRAAESARQASAYAISQLSLAEALWRADLTALRNGATADQAIHILRSLLAAFEAGNRLVHSARALWTIAEKAGAVPERITELEQTGKRLEMLMAEAKKALEHRTGNWQVSDSASLAQGLRLAQEGKTVPADEARAWFRQRHG